MFFPLPLLSNTKAHPTVGSTRGMAPEPMEACVLEGVAWTGEVITELQLGRAELREQMVLWVLPPDLGQLP